MLLRRRAARPAGSAALADSVHDVRGSTHDARVPRGTRGTVRTSPRRLNEASPKLSMTVGEQLPPARTVAGSAGGQGSTVFVQPGGLTLRESDDRRRDVHGYALSSSAFCPQLNPERDRGGEEQQSSANSHALWLPPCKATLTERFQWQRGDAVAAGLSLYARLLCSMPECQVFTGTAVGLHDALGPHPLVSVADEAGGHEIGRTIFSSPKL